MKRRRILLLAATLLSLTVLTAYSQRRDRATVEDDPVAVVRSYMQATYARDYRAAYRLIASADQRARDETSYTQAQEEFAGFSLDVARKLAAFMDLTVLEESATRQPLKITVGYRVPALESVAGLVLDWDGGKLDALSPAQRRHVLQTLDDYNLQGKLVSLRGRQTFQLVREGHSWRIFHDWAGGTRVRFRSAVAEQAPVEIRLAQKEIIARGNEPFQVNLKITNHGRQALRIRLNHEVEPRDWAGAIEMIECGLAAPVQLAAGAEQEFSMAYLLGDHGPGKAREFTITYAFDIKP